MENMTNDELFFLCVLTGAQELFGIEIPVEGLNEEGAKAKWEEVSKGLYESKILYDDQNGNICIRDDYAKISAAISFPDIAYEYAPDDLSTKYIYIKGSIYVQLIRKDDLQLKMYDTREDFISFLNKEFMIAYCEDNEENIFIQISEEELDKALEYFTNSYSIPANIFEGTELNIETIHSALSAFTQNISFIDFVGYRNNQETPSQALFKITKTEDGTWLFKICKGNIKMLKCNAGKALSEIINF